PGVGTDLRDAVDRPYGQCDGRRGADPGGRRDATGSLPGVPLGSAAGRRAGRPRPGGRRPARGSARPRLAQEGIRAGGAGGGRAAVVGSGGRTSRGDTMSHSRIGLAAALGTGIVVGRAISTEQATFARLAGSSIAGADAAGWGTDFLNAAYYRRAHDARDLDDLRLAFAVVTTYWARKDRRKLHAADVAPFHRAFGRRRLRQVESRRGTLSRGELLAGASQLLGDWFPEGYADDER